MWWPFQILKGLNNLLSSLLRKRKKRLKCYITRDELAHMAKQLKGPWNWPENLIKNNNLENEKELINFLKNIIKVSPKVKKK